MEGPLFEVVDEREFTDRKEGLKFLWSLASKAQKRLGSSYAMISRKGVGKTALLTMFYNQLFWQQEQVIPFYISFAEFRFGPNKRLKKQVFIDYYFKTLIMEYLAFKLKDGTLLKALQGYSAYQLKKFSKDKAFENLSEAIQTFENMWHEERYDQLLSYVIHFTSNFFRWHDEIGFLMIDEFQILTKIWDDDISENVDVTDMFQKTAEAKWCPMVVSGSAVSLISKTVFGGLLARRFSPYYLEPFSQEYTVEYAFKLAKLNEIKMNEPVAIELHRLTGGNPYYIWCMLNSYSLQNNAITTLDELERIYSYEMSERGGKLRGFWDTHFDENIKQINDKKIGLHALHHLAVSKEDLQIHELAKMLGTDTIEVESVLRNLMQADLVDRVIGGIYSKIKDPVLADYIESEYNTKLLGQNLRDFREQQTKKLKRQRGNLSRLLGEVAELYTRHLLLNFNEQQVNSQEVFNIDDGLIRLPKFKKIEHRTGVVIRGEIVEFDLIAEGDETWYVEVKYWDRAIPLEQIDRFFEKLEKVVGWRFPLETGNRIWYFSKNGFEPRAKQRLEELRIWHSDLNGFNQLCRAVNIGEVPVVNQ